MKTKRNTKTGERCACVRGSTGGWNNAGGTKGRGVLRFRLRSTVKQLASSSPPTGGKLGDSDDSDKYSDDTALSERAKSAARKRNRKKKRTESPASRIHTIQMERLVAAATTFASTTQDQSRDNRIRYDRDTLKRQTDDLHSFGINPKGLAKRIDVVSVATGKQIRLTCFPPSSNPSRIPQSQSGPIFVPSRIAILNVLSMNNPRRCLPRSRKYSVIHTQDSAEKIQILKIKKKKEFLYLKLTC